MALPMRKKVAMEEGECLVQEGSTLAPRVMAAK